MEQEYRVPVAEDDHIRADLAVQMVALSLNLRGEALMAGRRLSLRACRGRWMAMYLSHVVYGWTLERVGHVFAVNRATAGVGCRWSEEARSDPTLDKLLERLEATLRDLADRHETRPDPQAVAA